MIVGDESCSVMPVVRLSSSTQPSSSSSSLSSSYLSFFVDTINLFLDDFRGGGTGDSRGERRGGGLIGFCSIVFLK